jgi:hypothetical protein
VGRRKRREIPKSTDIVWCCRRNKLDCLHRDTALANRGLRQKDRGTRVAACPAERGRGAMALPPFTSRGARPAAQHGA